MKKFLLLFLSLVLFVVTSVAQRNIVSTPAEYDYSRYIAKDPWLLKSLVNITSTNDYTYVQFRFKVLKTGSIRFPSSTFLQGDGFRVNACALIDSYDGSQISFDRSYPITKGQNFAVYVIFGAIPVGVESVDYITSSFRFTNIPIKNPDTSIHTDWSEDSLRNWWTTHGMDGIEGIYDFWDCNNKEWWGNNKITVAVKKNNTNYEIIYLNGNKNSSFWKEGDLKASMKASAIPNLFKAEWYMDTKRINEDIVISFEDIAMSIKDKEQGIEATFLKMFPTAESNKTMANPQNSNINNNEDNYRGSGSGIIISTNGVVVTNYHVIEDAKNIDIVVKDNRNVSTYKAKVLASDKTNDLALLMIDDEKFLHFDSIPFAISTRTSEVGTSVFAMGYPMSLYMGDEVKITDGIISSRTGYQGDIVTYQISAPIQPGNSGGPLFDKKGYLVGITNAGIMDANNVGYAIKSSYVRNLIESAPISIDIPEVNNLQDLELTEQIKQLSKFVTHIKVK